ncbi:MAG: elongation factor Tu [Mycobacterium sp.]|nr:elongation factor Tu [Mycobacterium sp.]
MFQLTVEDVFAIKGRGTVATGRVETGTLRVGDAVAVNGAAVLRVDGIESFRKQRDEAAAGDTIGVLFRDAATSQISRGDVLTAAGGTEVTTPGVTFLA